MDAIAEGRTCGADIREPGRWPRYHRCGRKAKVEIGGAYYCGTHDPVRLKAIRAASDARWEAERRAAREQADAKQNEARDAARWRKFAEIRAEDSDFPLLIERLDSLIAEDGKPTTEAAP